MGTAGDDPRVSQAKTEGDVEFAWVPRQIEGDGPRVREREERERRQASTGKERLTTKQT